MKSLRRLSVACAFTLALTLPVFAGQIDTTVAPPPPAPAQTTTNGDIQTTVAEQAPTGSSEATSAGSATETALNLLQSLHVLF